MKREQIIIWVGRSTDGVLKYVVYGKSWMDIFDELLDRHIVTDEDLTNFIKSKPSYVETGDEEKDYALFDEIESNMTEQDWKALVLETNRQGFNQQYRVVDEDTEYIYLGEDYKGRELPYAVWKNKGDRLDDVTEVSIIIDGLKKVINDDEVINKIDELSYTDNSLWIVRTNMYLNEVMGMSEAQIDKVLKYITEGWTVVKFDDFYYRFNKWDEEV